jgi:hypothetical protein
MKRIYGLVFLVSCLLMANAGFCQEQKKETAWFKTHGLISLSGNYSNRQELYGYQLPPSWVILQMNGTLEVFTIPVTLSALYSTMQSDTYQPMNHISLKFDPKSVLSRKGEIPGRRIIKHFDVLEAGRARPAWSPLMLSGVPVNGVNAAVRFGSFYTAFTYGDIQREVYNAGFGNNQFRKTMYFGRLGIGKEGKNHFFLQALRAMDRESSHLSEQQLQFIRKPDTLVYLTDTFFIPADTLYISKNPEESMLAGIGGGLILFRQHLIIEGEVAGCLHTSNTCSDTIGGDFLPSWVMKLYTPRLSTSASWAVNSKVSLNLRTTRLQLTWQQTGPGFQSPGIPFIRQDCQTIQASGSQSLFRKKLTIQPQLRWYQDNMSRISSSTTTTLVWGVAITWQPAKLPYLNIQLSPHTQSVSSTDAEIKHEAMIMTVSSGKNYRLHGKTAGFTGLTWSNQSMKSTIETQNTFYTGNSIMLQQGIIPSFPVSFNLNAMYYFQDFGSSNKILRQLGFSLQYKHRKFFSAGVGIRYNDLNMQEKRTTLNFNCSADFKKWGQFRLVAEPEVFSSIINPQEEFSDYSLRIIYSKRW